MTPFPSAADLLLDLAEQGIDVQLHGDAIRYRPKNAMTPAILERLLAHKAELLQFLDTDAAVTEIRQSVECRWKDLAWRSAWERRFQAGHYSDFASLGRVLDSVIDQAAEHHRRNDWSAFASATRYLHRLASGEIWDQAEQMAAKFCSP